MSEAEFTGISEAMWDRLERGGQIQSRALDNYIRLLFSDDGVVDLRRTNAQVMQPPVDISGREPESCGFESRPGHCHTEVALDAQNEQSNRTST